MLQWRKLLNQRARHLSDKFEIKTVERVWRFFLLLAITKEGNFICKEIKKKQAIVRLSCYAK